MIIEVVVNKEGSS